MLPEQGGETEFHLLDLIQNKMCSWCYEEFRIKEEKETCLKIEEEKTNKELFFQR